MSRYYLDDADIAANRRLFDEITNLVEQPVALLGGFEERYRSYPPTSSRR